MLIGSYFLAEYSLEAAALFNPSIVPHPDQTGVAADAVRFILSLRATGEGHISSITFRTGDYTCRRPHRSGSPLTASLRSRVRFPIPLYEKDLFSRKLIELGLACDFTAPRDAKTWRSFALGDLRARLRLGTSPRATEGQEDQDAHGIWILARSNHEVQFQPEQKLSERILFPATPSQRNGIEDARFVCFQNEDGSLHLLRNLHRL